MREIKSHERINDIFLGPLERPALQWLAAHMPSWVMPDTLTAVGVLGAIVIMVSYWLTSYDKAFLWLASLGLVINWFGDSLDGTLARYRKIQRPKYGFFVDHTVDAFNEVLIILGLGLSPYVKFDIALLALVGYLLMSVQTFIRTCVSGVFQISYGKIGPTEVRVIVIAANTLMFFIGNPSIELPLGTTSVYDLIIFTIAIALFAVFIGSSIREARRLSKID